MLAQEVAHKYAHALFDSAQAHGVIDAVQADVNDVSAVAEHDDSLMRFLSTPNISESAKEQLIRRLFAERLQKLSVEFLLVLLEKKRIRFLPEVIDEFTRRVEADHGIGRATVITAVPLNDGQKSALTEKLTAKTKLKIVLEEKVDTSIIGGMIVILHNEIIDGSIRHGLEQVEDQLSKVRVH